MARKYLEDRLQIQIATYLKLQYPQLLWFHCPNGGHRDERTGAKFKAMGVRAGVADLIFSWPNGKAAIELKVGKNDLTDPQKLFQQQWIHSNGQYALCRNLDEVIDALNSWGVPK